MGCAESICANGVAPFLEGALDGAQCGTIGSGAAKAFLRFAASGEWMATFIEAELTVTLMRLTPNGDYVESGDRSYRYYFAAPEAWARFSDGALQAHAKAAADRIYAETNARLRAAEPTDLNYLAVLSSRARVLAPDEATSWPWLSTDKPVWDASSTFVVHGDGTVAAVNPLELGNAVPAERPSVALDDILPSLVTKQLPACAAGYVDALQHYRDARPLDETSRVVWGLVVYFWCVLDRFATRGDVADPWTTLDRMIDRLAADGRVSRDVVDAARQIYRKTLEYSVFRPNVSLAEFVYERAWSVRYADLDPATPSAFQGFVRCLCACRDTLATFDVVDSPNAAPAASSVFAKIDAFVRGILLPTFEEMRPTLERHGKRVVVAEADAFGDAFLDSFFAEVHPDRRLVRELATAPPPTAPTRFVGPTFAVVDAERYDSRYAGTFFDTIVFEVGPDDEVSASPFVVYHMKFDNKLHAFAHRFDNAQARQPIETIDRYAIQNHFLGAYDYFKMHARSDQRPW